MHIPREPQSNRPGPIQFFLQFHQNAVSHAHYFLYYDFQQLCKKLLFTIAEQFDALRFAMVAFSALIYSVKVDIAAREQSPSLLCDSLVRIAFVSAQVSK